VLVITSPGMGPHQRVRASADRLKVFPLPSAVLLPGAALPLHIFEPRYRALLEDCLASDRVMVLADLDPAPDPYAPVARPPLRPVACAGLVVWNEALPDGRQNILLQGVTRVQVVEEWPAGDKLYREIRATPWNDAPYQGPLEEYLRRAVLEVAGRLTGGVADNLLQLAARAQGGALADAVAAALLPDVEARQAVLAELDAAARLERVLDEVGDLIARMGAAAPRGPVN
jgi:Lon protease-like protein